jgi:hypothetical protein
MVSMGVLQQITDRYNRFARLIPAVVVVLPLSVLAVTSVPVVVTVWGTVAALVVVVGLPFVVSQVVRDRGLRIQPNLFHAWGGRSSEIMLRWRSTSTKAAVARRHQLVQTHLGITLPDEAAEAADPAEADEAYEVATAALRERTRDKAMFPLVFEENIAYGFRRNAYACRTAAIVICVLTTVGTVLLARFLSRPPRLEAADGTGHLRSARSGRVVHLVHRRYGASRGRGVRASAVRLAGNAGKSAATVAARPYSIVWMRSPLWLVIQMSPSLHIFTLIVP